jgi:hypothetical protein
MLLVGAVHIALGWAWHIAYRARHNWRLKREGALAAAAFVALLGAVEALRSGHASGATQSEPTTIAIKTPEPDAAPAITAQATPPAAVDQAETTPQADPVETVAALPSPEPETRDDPIGAKIMERLGEDVATGSLADDPEPQPAKPHKHKATAKND